MMVRCFKEPREVPSKSKEMGYPYFEDKVFFEIIKVGGQQITRPADDAYVVMLKQQASDNSDKERSAFADLCVKTYEAFMRGEEHKVEGLPVGEWGMITRSEAESLKRMGVATVEQLATSPELLIERMGNRGDILRRKARAFLEAAKGDGKIVEELEMLRKKVETLENHVKERDNALQVLQAKLEGKSKRTKESENE